MASTQRRTGVPGAEIRARRACRPRGPVAWYGGKAPLAGWLRELVPTTAVYVEPYGGAASLLFAREPARIEVYNDLDGRLVNLFRALQEPRRRRRLEQRLRCTFYARAEFAKAFALLRQDDVDEDDLAWAFFVVQNQSYGAVASSPGQWARAVSPGSDRPRAWWSRVAAIDDWGQRLTGVQIEQADALEVLGRWDGPETTFYADPPYVHDTRRTPDVYAAEPDDDHHRALIELLIGIEGACVLSGYAHELYQPLEVAGWERIERDVAIRTGKVSRRTEVVWRNERAIALAPRRP